MNPYDAQLFNTKPEVRYKISEKEKVKEEIADPGIKDPKGRQITLRYIVRRLKVEVDPEGRLGAWGPYTFRNGPGTYYMINTAKLKNGEPWGATNNTKYVSSEEEALQIGQDYIKKGMKKLTSPSTFKEYYKESVDSEEVYPKTSMSVNKELRRLGIPVRLVSAKTYYYWTDLKGNSSEIDRTELIYRASDYPLSKWIAIAKDVAETLPS